MKALTSYQQAILAELGIVQWRLRAPDKLTLLSEPLASKANSTQTSMVGAAHATEEQVVEPLAQAQQDSAKNQIESRTEQKADSVPTPKPVQQVDSQHPMFRDIQLALKSLQHSAEFHWQVEDNLGFDGKVLSAPSPQSLSNTPQLKKQLWQLLQQHI